MISNELLNTPKLKSKIQKFCRNKKIFDILIYGSAVRGKIELNDIDVAIILRSNQMLENKLLLAQEFRKTFSFTDCELDVKVIDFSDFLDSTFIARSSILAEGYSLIGKRFIHEDFGFKTFVIFSYSLKGFSTSKKKIMYYALNGRREEKGLMKKHDASAISNTLIKVPLQHSEYFKEFFKNNQCKFTEKISVEYKF